MAATILANAFVFHETLAHGPGGLGSVKTWEELRNGAGNVSKAATLTEWRKILEVNYWPIFDIARRILQVIPTSHTAALIARLIATAEKLLENRLMRSHDLTGAVFQRLIVDRKFLAAYYTTPSSAALLAALALPDSRPFPGLSWGTDSDLRALRIGDFACGTGTLLSSAYQRLGQLHELHGGDAEQLHPTMMSSVLLGCDVLPAAARLAASAWLHAAERSLGASLGLGIFYTLARAPDPVTAASLSAFAQSVGYLLAATGPLLLGYLHSVTAGWTVPVWVLVAVVAVQLVTGWLAGRDRTVPGLAPVPAADQVI